MESLIFSLNATIPIFLLMVLGYILKLLKVVDEPFIKTLNSFNYKITLPVLLFRDIAESDFFTVWDTTYVLYCFFVTLTCIVIIGILAMIFYKGSYTGEFVQASYRGSAAVLGIAFIQSIYGNTGMAPLMIIGTVPLYNIAAVLILSFSGPNKGPIDKKSLLASIRGILTNPIILGIVLGMIVSVSGISFSSIIKKSIDNVSSLATPLALIGLGAGFEGRKALKQIKPTIVCSLIKLLIQPLFFLPIAAWLSFRDEKMVAILIMLGAPTTVSCHIMAKNMGHEGTLTSSVVISTTFLSTVSITLWLFLLRTLGLI
ncbi:MAG TPA: AEC family transporter [Lachnospiraceae bacterium]|nr:AEC family transporter [Lachnospiraceae bacterium]